MKTTLRSAVAGLVAAGAIVAFPRAAHALELGTPASDHPHRTPQNFALELRFSPYYPAIDDEPGLAGKTPFKDNFGENPRLEFGLELDWETLRIPHIGTIGPGLSVGTVSMSRNASTVTGRTSGDEYTLTIYPFALNAVLRADAVWRDLHFPIVPYGKAGLGIGFWRASNTGGTAEAAGVKGKGYSLGTNLAIGAMFILDALDLYASTNMDNEVGINTTSVYFEYSSLALNGFGSNDLRVGSTSWTMGLVFEF